MYLWKRMFGNNADDSKQEGSYHKSFNGVYRSTTDTPSNNKIANIRYMTSYIRPSVLKKGGEGSEYLLGKRKVRCDDSDTSSLSSRSTISNGSTSHSDEYEIVSLGRAVETEELCATATFSGESEEDVDRTSVKKDDSCGYSVGGEEVTASESRLCLFEEENTRVSLFPIKHIDVWNMYKRAVASFWTVDEVDLSRDLYDWKTKLNVKERGYIMTVLAFFLGADRLVNDNLLQNVSSVVQLFEAQFFYQFQIAIENIHTEMYNLLIDTLVEDEFEKDRMFKSVEEFVCIKLKYDWCRRWTDDQSVSFEERIIAFACVEGIFFSSSFAAIFWLKKRGLMHGLCFSNELISRDEGLHCDFAVMIYKNYTHHKTPVDTVRQIIREACDIEQMFVDEALPDNLVGLSRAQMRDYVAYISERLMIDLTGQPLCPFSQLPTNPLGFMENISLQGKTNFFERKVSEYRAAADSTVIESYQDPLATVNTDSNEGDGDYSVQNLMISMSNERIFH